MKCNVESIRLVNFRNFFDYTAEFKPSSITVIVGENGVGKSNILEAISLLYPGSGMRSAKYSEMTCFSKDGWSLMANTTDYIVDMLYTGGVRQIKINKAPIEKVSELANGMTIIWCTPRIMSDFVSAQSSRRRFFDRIVYSFDAPYAGYCLRYNKAVAERNLLLRGNNNDKRWLGSLESEIADNMLYILKSRRDILQDIQSRLLDHNLRINMSGSLESAIASGGKYDKDLVMKIMESNRSTDSKNGSTFGTHRTRFDISIIGVQFDHCSTGEQKIAILNILFSQIMLKINRDGIHPVLLFDDIVESLGDNSLRCVLERIDKTGCQAIISSNRSMRHIDGIPGVYELAVMDNDN